MSLYFTSNSFDNNKDFRKTSDYLYAIYYIFICILNTYVCIELINDVLLYAPIHLTFLNILIRIYIEQYVFLYIFLGRLQLYISK